MNNVKSGSLISRFFELLLYIPAILFMPFWELGKFLTRKAYGGGWVRGILVGISGLPATVYGALFCGNVVGWHYGLSWPLWSLAGALGAAITAGIVWPALYLAILKPLWDLCDKLFQGNSKLAKNVILPVSSWAISSVRHLPYAENLWQVSEGKTKAGRTWGMRALSGLLDLGAFAAGLAAAYFVYQGVVGLIPLFGALPILTGVYLSQILAASLAVTSLVLVTGFLAQYVAYGRDQKDHDAFTAVAYSGIFTYLAVSKIGFLAALSPVGLVVASVLAFVISLAYVLPALIAALQGGLMEAVLKGWKELLNAAYDAEEDKAYALFFAQVANIILALAEAAVAFFVAGAVHLPAVLTIAVSALVGLYSYASNPRDLIGSKSVSPIFGMVIAASSGLAAYHFSPASLSAHGFYHYALAVGITFLVGLIIYPLAYLALRFVAKPVAPAVGPALASVSSAATDSYKKIADRLSKLQRAAFNDSTPYSGMFGHLFILAVIAAALWIGGPLALPFIGTGFWLTTVLSICVAINVYMLLAKLSSRYGAETFSVATAGMSLLAAGHWAYGLSASNYWAAGVVGLVAAFITGGVIAPAFYLAVRLPANVVLTPWLAPLIKGIFDGLWFIYAGFWKKFSIVFRIVSAVLGPVFAIMASIWAGVRSAYTRMFGGR